jgi:hypothetical protein
MATTITIPLTWDRTAYQEDTWVSDGIGGAIQGGTTFNLLGEFQSPLFVGREDQTMGGSVPGIDRMYRTAVKASLAAIPRGSPILAVVLNFNVNSAFGGSMELRKMTTDVPDTLGANDLYSAIPGTSTYLTIPNSTLNTLGDKSVSIPNAVADLDAKVRASQLFTLGWVSVGADYGTINSSDGGSAPTLSVTYRALASGAFLDFAG